VIAYYQVPAVYGRHLEVAPVLGGELRQRSSTMRAWIPPGGLAIWLADEWTSSEQRAWYWVPALGQIVVQVCPWDSDRPARLEVADLGHVPAHVRARLVEVAGAVRTSASSTGQ
jgi:hypothetical protein